jgi:hypothetical protein
MDLQSSIAYDLGLVVGFLYGPTGVWCFDSLLIVSSNHMWCASTLVGLAPLWLPPYKGLLGEYYNFI